MKKIGLTVVVLLLGLAGTAHAQDRAQRHYSQRTDPYALVYNYWAHQQIPGGFDPGTLFGGAGIVVGTRLRCNACGALGHYSCGVNVPLFFTHYSWEMMP